MWSARGLANRSCGYIRADSRGPCGGGSMRTGSGRCTYVNMEDPWRWTNIGYDSHDWVLDLVVWRNRWLPDPTWPAPTLRQNWCEL